jgi:hypothetical protein
METFAAMGLMFQPDQTQQMRSTLQQTHMKKTSPRLIVKYPKMSVYTKRSGSEALRASDQQNVLKKMIITQAS